MQHMFFVILGYLSVAEGLGHFGQGAFGLWVPLGVLENVAYNQDSQNDKKASEASPLRAFFAIVLDFHGGKELCLLVCFK